MASSSIKDNCENAGAFGRICMYRFILIGHSKYLQPMKIDIVIDYAMTMLTFTARNKFLDKAHGKFRFVITTLTRNITYTIIL